MWRIENDTHKASCSDTDNRDGEDPSEEDPSESPPVEGAPITIAHGDAKSGTDDAHGGGYWETIVGSEDDGDCRSQFHRETTRGRVESQAVTDDTHNVVAVGCETDDDHCTTEDENPDGDWGVFSSDGSVGPDIVDNGVGTDGVGDVVGAVGERCSAGGHYLEEGVEMFGAVIVLGDTSVHGVQTSRIRATFTGLKLKDIDGCSVSENGGDLIADDDPEVPGQKPGAFDGVWVSRFSGMGGCGSARRGTARGGMGLFDISTFTVGASDWYSGGCACVGASIKVV